MKKQLIITALAIATSIPAFGQGYFLLTGNKNTVYDGFTTPGTSVVAPGTVEISYLVGPAASTLSVFGTTGSSTGSTNVSSPWSSLTSLPTGWSWATVGGVLQSVADNASGLAKGGWGINGGTQVALDGTVVGDTYTLYVVGWSSVYSSPAAAAAAGSAVGWSIPIQVTAQASTGTALNYNASGGTAFGVQALTAVPEPATFALAGLGAAALMVFRRRK